MKITVQMNVYNAEDYLAYSLGGIYKFADRVVIIDGAFNEKMPSCFSTDQTEGIVRDFHDVQKKIIYVKTSSKSQVEQRNKVWQYAIGDWLFLVDYDEVYRKSELVAAKKFLAETSDDFFWIQAKVFVNSFHRYFELRYRRIFRLKDDMEFVAPNKIRDSEGNFPPWRIIPNLTMYHYAWVTNENRLSIKRLQRRLESPKEFRNGKYVLSETTKEFSGTHPNVMEKHPFWRRK